MRITVEFIDGTVQVFEETSRAGGSWCTSGRAELGWYIVKDAYGSETYIPADSIKQVKTSSQGW